MDDSVTITLTKAEALVLFELLADFHDQPQLSIRDHAERVVLWRLGASLEKQLTEIFRPDYKSILEESRRLVVDQDRPTNPAQA